MSLDKLQEYADKFNIDMKKKSAKTDKMINKTKEEGIKLPKVNRTKTSQEVKEEVKLSNEFAFSIFESRKSKESKSFYSTF